MGPERALRHKKLYLQGGDVIIRVRSSAPTLRISSCSRRWSQVENLLFRIHSYFLTRESAFFRDLLLHTSTFGDEIKPSSDDCPFYLEDCSADEFTIFCWVFYNPYVFPPSFE
jgi:hypothetical protein